MSNQTTITMTGTQFQDYFIDLIEKMLVQSEDKLLLITPNRLLVFIRSLLAKATEFYSSEPDPLAIIRTLAHIRLIIETTLKKNRYRCVCYVCKSYYKMVGY